MCNLFILFQHVSSDAVSQPAMQLERHCFHRFVLRCSTLNSWYWFKTHHTRCKYVQATAWGARSLSKPGSNHLKPLTVRKAQQPQMFQLFEIGRGFSKASVWTRTYWTLEAVALRIVSRICTRTFCCYKDWGKAGSGCNKCLEICISIGATEQIELDGIGWVKVK